MSTPTNRQEHQYEQKSQARMKGIIFWCGAFSFVSTWAGAYKVTQFFSELSFLGIEPAYIHFGFSLFTASLIFYIIYSILLNNLERTRAEYANRIASTTFILAGTTVIALSFWLSVEGLTEGYRNFRMTQILAPYKGELANFEAQVELEISKPRKDLIDRLKIKRKGLSGQEKDLKEVNEKIKAIDARILDKRNELNSINSMRTDSLLYKSAYRARQLNRDINSLVDQRNGLIKTQANLQDATKLNEISSIIERLSNYSFGKTLPTTFMNDFNRGETLLSTDITSIQRDKLDELHEVQVKLTSLQTEYNSFLTVIKKGLHDNEDGSRGFVIIILFFAMLGDIVPLLISLKNNNPNTIEGFFKESVQWFHSMTNELAKVDFVRKVSHACVGFLFSMDTNTKYDEWKKRIVQPITQLTVFEPMVFVFNFLLAVLIVWGLIDFVMPDKYYTQIGRIFDNWTVAILDLIERASW